MPARVAASIIIDAERGRALGDAGIGHFQRGRGADRAVRASRIFRPNAVSCANWPLSSPQAATIGPSYPARGGAPMIEASTKGAPAFVTISPMRRLVGGLIALQST